MIDETIVCTEAQYIGFRDFFKRKEKIKEAYEKMTEREKRIYKLYVYSMCFENEYIKDLIWVFLNGDGRYEDLLELSAENRKRIRIEKKRWQKYANKDKYEIDELE